MGLFDFCLAGVGFMLIGAFEASVSYYYTLLSLSNKSTLTTINEQRRNPFGSSSIRFIAVGFLSIFIILNSVVSSTDALHTKDQIGFVLQFVVISVASLFLLYSISGFLSIFTGLPSSIPNLILLFAFGQEFVFFYLQRKDPSGIENRYFDLLLVPIAICILTTFLELGLPKKSILPSLGRGIGVFLQGMWFFQMGVSFFTDLIVHGCVLHEMSRGNFTVKCKGHPEYHRGRAIATLQFNCNLAILVVLIAGVYSFVGHKYGLFPGDYSSYKPLTAELHKLVNQPEFTLDSDDDEEVMVENNVTEQKAVGIVSDAEVNGFGAH